MSCFSFGPSGGTDSTRKPAGLVQEVEESDKREMEKKKFVIALIYFWISLHFGFPPLFSLFCVWIWMYECLMYTAHSSSYPSIIAGAGIAQWLELRTCDRKVAGLNPCWGGGRIFFYRVNFLCWLLFRYPFHPRVTAVARKRPRSSCQKCRWQVTAKHTYTLCMWLCMKWHGAWLYGVHRTRRDWLSGSRFLWHQPCQRCKYTTSVDI